MLYLMNCDARVLKLHGSKVSRGSDLRSVPYNRPVGVRSFVKSVKSLREINITLEPYKIT